MKRNCNVVASFHVRVLLAKLLSGLRRELQFLAKLLSGLRRELQFLA
jgi:hypothetical protein